MVRKKYSRKEICWVVFGTLLTISILTFYLWQLTENIRIGYEIKRLEDKIHALHEEVQQLEAQKASLLSLERVEKIARDKLALTEPRNGQIIYENFKPEP